MGNGLLKRTLGSRICGSGRILMATRRGKSVTKYVHYMTISTMVRGGCIYISCHVAAQIEVGGLLSSRAEPNCSEAEHLWLKAIQPDPSWPRRGPAEPCRAELGWPDLCRVRAEPGRPEQSWARNEQAQDVACQAALVQTWLSQVEPSQVALGERSFLFSLLGHRVLSFPDEAARLTFPL